MWKCIMLLYLLCSSMLNADQLTNQLNQLFSKLQKLNNSLNDLRTKPLPVEKTIEKPIEIKQPVKVPSGTVYGVLFDSSIIKIGEALSSLIKSSVKNLNIQLAEEEPKQLPKNFNKTGQQV